MRGKDQNHLKSAANGRKTTRAPKARDREKVATAIHHCLRYLSRDARQNGMAQTASLLDMIAHLAVDEARAARPRG